jgi:predicted O-methyltransferase YrrM
MTAFASRTDYIRQLFADETPEQRAAWVDGGISVAPEVGRLLEVLARLCGARRIVEIGAFSGYSALWLARALPPDGSVVSIEKDPARAAAARTHTAHDPRITVIEGDALKVLPEISGPFDLAFIDADKLNYARYLDWAEANVRRGGLIIGDNTFLSDAVWRDDAIERVRPTARAAMREFNQRLADRARYASVMLDTPQGLTVGLKLF